MSRSFEKSPRRATDYRSHHESGEALNDHDLVAQRHLQDAAEALTIATLVLDRGDDETRDQMFARVSRGRELLVEAVTALSQARVFVAGVMSYDLPVLMASERDPAAELSRLQHIASRLAWRNHEFLPHRDQGKPISAEDEAQLESLCRGLTVRARIEQLGRHRWWAVAAAGTALIPWLGWIAGTVAMGSAVVGTWRSLAPDPQERPRPALPAGVST